MSRNALLVVRAGDRSLHPGWLTGRGAAERRFDLHVSYFGDDPDPFPDRPADVTLSFEKGGKWTGLDACLDKLGDRLDAYGWIGFPDDDLKADCAVWNRFFEVIERLRPMLAQPALHWRSFSFHDLVLQRPGVEARWTDFVEIMAPVFRRDFFQQVRPHFGFSPAGFGYDFYWSKLADARETRSLCIVDSAPVLHTRAFGAGSLYKAIAATGETALDHHKAFEAAYDVREHPPRAWWAVLPDGRTVPAGDALNRRLYLHKKLRKWREFRGVTEIR